MATAIGSGLDLYRIPEHMRSHVCYRASCVHTHNLLPLSCTSTSPYPAQHTPSSSPLSPLARRSLPVRAAFLSFYLLFHLHARRPWRRRGSARHRLWALFLSYLSTKSK
ncbi:hypothetical protein PISMIDRAFT_518982 [Pisolithus microcarpus 441]|uniref:Uncharacterized protein n=1 Tax=Pisolithus microcarpus 441 TaxID=765257 RepID=A0A0C9ZT20_9AGAM|nr:hypothetical protein PISMIDRAFT_518982 [Pisolithus microcarpus 441]